MTSLVDSDSVQHRYIKRTGRKSAHYCDGWRGSASIRSEAMKKDTRRVFVIRQMDLHQMDPSLISPFPAWMKIRRGPIWDVYPSAYKSSLFSVYAHVPLSSRFHTKRINIINTINITMPSKMIQVSIITGTVMMDEYIYSVVNLYTRCS